MQFTPQQLAGGGRYSSKTKIGNWSEDLSLQNVRLAEYLKRKAAGKPYGEFMKEWEQKRPPEDALKYFGEFPGVVA